MTAKAKMAASPLLAALHDTATVSKWSHHVNLLYSLECVHIDSQLRSAAMEATKVGIREFRSGLAEYIAASGPVAVTRHGQTVGYFIPVHGQAEADMAALKKVSKSLRSEERRVGKECR